MFKMTNQSSFKLWVKSEPFMLGTISNSDDHTIIFGAEMLQKLLKCKCVASRCRNIESLEMRSSDWIFCLRKHFPNKNIENLMNNYWLVCYQKPDERIRRDEIKASSDRNGQHILTDNSNDEETISILKFILLLYLQNVHSVEQCSTTYLEEEWLALQTSWHGSKVYDEIKYLKFVKSHIEEMIELIEDQDLLQRGKLSLQTVEKFGLIIEGHHNSNTCHVQPIKDFVLMEREKLGYSDEKGKDSVSVAAFCMWVKTHLDVNSFGLVQLSKNGQKLPWLHVQERKNSARKACIVTNAHTVPVKKKIVYFSRIVNQTLAQMSRILHGSTVHIQHCSKSFIYLLSPMRSLWIENCHNCTLVLGPVASTLEVMNCKNLRVICISRRVQIRNSRNSTFFFLTPTEPLLFEDQNAEITFAPYNTFYPMLEEHMSAAGISKKVNKWDSPLILDNCKENVNVCRIMPVQEFSLFVIPFYMEGSTMAVPTNMPLQYRKRIEIANAKYQKWTALVGSSSLSHEENKQLQLEIRSKFLDWCTSSGTSDELMSLHYYTKLCQHT